MPFTDNAHGWLVDAITPMAPVFSAAPLALLRGNHEACDRAGNGFFLFFDPRLETATECEPVDDGGTLEPPKEQVTPPWTFTLPVAQGRALKVAMVDTAYGSDDTISKWAHKGHEVYLQADAMTTPKPGIESWLMTHRPLFGRTPEESFFVRCDSETNPPEVIDAGQVVTLIGLAPDKPAEFIVFRISKFQGGTEIDGAGTDR